MPAFDAADMAATREYIARTDFARALCYLLALRNALLLGKPIPDACNAHRLEAQFGAQWARGVHYTDDRGYLRGAHFMIAPDGAWYVPRVASHYNSRPTGKLIMRRLSVHERTEYVRMLRNGGCQRF